MSEDELTRKLTAVLARRTKQPSAVPDSVSIVINGGLHIHISGERTHRAERKPCRKPSRKTLLHEINQLAAKFFRPQAWSAILKRELCVDSLEGLPIEELQRVRDWSARFHDEVIRST